jgi:hypothetical protein
MTSDMEDKIKELAAYVREHVEDYEEYLQLALKRMDKMRCPFEMAADEGFYNDVVSAIEDWCLDNDKDFFELDLDEVIDGDDGIIWEE